MQVNQSDCTYRGMLQQIAPFEQGQHARALPTRARRETAANTRDDVRVA
jgi:hypothetical protein